MSMVTLCILLLTLGLVCLVVEIFVPGFGVFGIFGLLLMIVSAVLAVMYLPYGWWLVAAETGLLAAFGFLVFRHIRKKQLYGKLIMNETLDEMAPAGEGYDELIGEAGQVITPLRPFGEASFKDRKLEVCSESAYIEQGARIVVTGIRNNRIMVRRAEHAGN